MRRRAASLLLLLWIGTGCAGSDSGTAVRTLRIWSGQNPDFLIGDISPDGRYLAETDWDTGDLQLVDLETGAARPVTGEGYPAGGYAWAAAFSSDGRRLAVAWYLNEAATHELRVMNRDGTASRVLVPARDDRIYIDPVDWTPSDARVLVAVQGTDLVWKLGLVSVDDGSLRIVKTLSWLAPGGEQSYPYAEVAPDGAHVAYDYRPDPEARARDIYALALDGSGESKLVSGPATNRLLGWLPEGRGILFYSDRSGTPDIWRLPVRDGRPAGEPDLVRSDVEGIIPLGFTSRGFAYGATDRSRQVHTAAVDLESGGMHESPRPVGDPPALTSLSADWSPDGERLAYVAHGRRPGSVETLVVRSLADEVLRSIPLSPTFHTSAATFEWLDERTIYLFGVEKGRNGIYRLDPRDGSFRRLPDPETGGGGALKQFGVGAGGRTFYLTRPAAEGGGAREILARDADSGAQRVIATARVDRRGLAVSPDGGKLAYVAPGTDRGSLEIRVMRASGAAGTRNVYRDPSGRMRRWPLAWTPDGSRLLFVRDEVDNVCSLWSVRLEGDGEPLRVARTRELCSVGNDISLHPDGRRIAFTAGDGRGSIWMLEGWQE